jgi:hypothetical protein
MANEMMQGLLQSLLQTPEQQQQAEGVQNVNLLSQPNPLAATLAYMMPQRNAGMERGVRGLFGLPQQMTNAELATANGASLTTSAGLKAAAQNAMATGNRPLALQFTLQAQQLTQQEQEVKSAQALATTNRAAGIGYLSTLMSNTDDEGLRGDIAALAPLVASGVMGADKLPAAIKDIYASRNRPAPSQGMASATTKNYANGVVQMTLPSGEIVVKTPDNKIVPHEQIQGVLREAAQFEATQAAAVSGARAGATSAANAAIERADEYYGQLGGIQTSIAQFGEVRRLIDEGANTGRIAALLPTIKQATIRLEQLQREMGLNVIQNTTFGSLSEGELKMALDTALPTGLNGDELRAWASQKEEAMRKLLSYTQNAASFLYSGGTMGDWITQQKDLQALQETVTEQAAPEETRTLSDGTAVRVRRAN